MTEALLTRDEIAQWTRARTRKGQLAVLRRNRIRFIVAADGWPSVARAELERPPDGTVTVTGTEPDWDALMGRATT